MKIPKCKNTDCNEPCCESGAPHETMFTIPFTKIEVRIWNWSKPVYADYCPDCLLDNVQEPERVRYQSASNDGYRKGYEDGLRENI